MQADEEVANSADDDVVAPEPQTTVKQVAAYGKESSQMLSVLFLSVLLMVALLGILIFTQLMSIPSPARFSLNSNLQIIDPVPLDEEGISTAALLNWVNSLLIDAFSFNYSNQERQRDKLVEYMNDTALNTYLRLFFTDEDLASVKEMKYVVSVRPEEAPEILVSRAFRGRHAWQIRVPAIIRFQNALVRQSQRVDVEFLVLRVPETESALGIKVASFSYKVNSRSSRRAVRR